MLQTPLTQAINVYMYYTYIIVACVLYSVLPITAGTGAVHGMLYLTQ